MKKKCPAGRNKKDEPRQGMFYLDNFTK
jgi:hypothetical protein